MRYLPGTLVESLPLRLPFSVVDGSPILRFQTVDERVEKVATLRYVPSIRRKTTAYVVRYSEGAL